MQKIILALLAGRNHDGNIRSKDCQAGLVEGCGHQEHCGHFMRFITICVDSAVGTQEEMMTSTWGI